MGVVGCMECGSVHRNTAQYALHIKATNHRKIEDGLWYVSRIGRNEGVFFQALVQEIDWAPSYYVEENEIETILHVYVSESENISLITDRKCVNRKQSFDYFDAELSIYTVHLMFNLYNEKDTSAKK
ncbi:hypothetical protein NEMIN01_1999 [Nematocida minor]|uniref:uncharacterized protein n=1 Tax=Nematocida minor TaxID=1912983 RepID=UPI00221EE86A|nr:uncharacterized protein NEMIN01_1999 [Nematocida minor]KAI5192412.1 hypothetical protein NEMIN01_1999 [Nematocida minor]